MNPTEFVDRLAQVAPSAAEMMRLGLSSAEASDFHDSYICRKRGCDAQATDPLLLLLNGWELGHVEIGMVSFLPEPREMPGKIRVGSVEADPLYILNDAGELISEDLHAPGYVVWNVVRNGSMFLDALIPAAEFLTKCCVRSSSKTLMRRERQRTNVRSWLEANDIVSSIPCCLERTAKGQRRRNSDRGYWLLHK